MKDGELRGLRNEIDQIDAAILDQLARRVEIVRKLGQHKKAVGLPALEPERLRQVLEQRVGYGTTLGLRSTFINELWTRIHNEALLVQESE